MSSSERFAERIRTQALQTQREARRRSEAAAQAILRGEIQVPLRCSNCRTPSITPEDGELYCLQCGTRTSFDDAHRGRRQEIQMIIENGADPRASQRGS